MPSKPKTPLAREVKVQLTARQTLALDTFWNPNIRYLLYGGARGGGKTYLGCWLMFNYASWVIQHFNLSASKYPLPIGFLGRARGVDFNDTTLETWKKIIPPEAYYLRPHDKEIVIYDRVKFLYGGLDRVEDLHKFTSAEYGCLFLDQAEECTRDQVADLRGCLRLQVGNEPLPYKELYTANPANCWLKDEFILNPQSNYAFVPALPADNPFLPEGYLNTLTEAYKHRPELLEAYLHGSWDVLEGGNIIIRDLWVRDARLVTPIDPYPRRVFGVDVARYGDDSTVVYELEGTDIRDALVFGQKDTMYTAGMIHIWAQEKKPELIGVDVIGLGAGVADRLREMGNPVLDVDSSRKAGDYARFRNLRAEMWWTAGRDFAEKNITLTWDDTDLRRELTAVGYEIKNGRVQVESKDVIKSRLGRSPDKAEAYLIGLHALRQVSGEERVIYRVDPGDNWARKHSGKYCGL